MLKWLFGIGLLACIWSAPAEAACSGGTCFVVPAGGSSATNTTWTLTSGGSSCACVPTTTDAVILDSLAGQLTISGSLSIGTLDASGTGGSGSPYTNTVTHTANTITINTAAANSFKLVPGMTWTSGTSNAVSITFANTSGSAHITSAGKNFAAIIMNGVGGTAVQDDDINITNATTAGTLTITNGVWDANGHITTTSLIASSGAATRSFILGSRLVVGGKIINTSTLINFTSTLTLNVASAGTIEIVPTVTAGVQGVAFVGGGLTYPAIVFDDNTTVPHNLNITGNNTYTSWTAGAGWDLTIPGSGTQTISGALALTGTAAHFTGLRSLGTNAPSTLAITGTCTGTFTVLFGDTFTTCVPAFTSSINLGGNTLNGGTITAPSIGAGGGGYIIGN